MQYSNVAWRKGQPYSEMFDDIYYSSGEDEAIPGESEFQHVFFSNNNLPARWKDRSRFVIAELGFGSGINCILTIREWLQQLQRSGQDACLHYIAIEKYPLSPGIIAELGSRYPQLKPYYDEVLASYPPAIAGIHSRCLFNNRVVIHYRFMDVVKALQDESLDVDAWYLDGFSPATNPDMWSQQVCELLAQNSHAGSTCSTYTSAGFVRRNLQAAGFNVSKVPGHGNKREMLVAGFAGRHDESLKFHDRPWFALPAACEDMKRATVIGAGIAGLGVAYALVQRGWEVTMIDRHGDIAGEATSNPAPIVYPRLSVDNDTDNEFFTAAYHYMLHVLRSLQQRYQQRFWFGDGLLQLMDEQRIRKIISKNEFNSDYLSITEGAVNGQARVSFPAAGVVLPAVLCEVLRQECGEKLHFMRAEVSGIEQRDNQWHCLSADRSVNSSGVLIIANGTGINQLGLSLQYPVEAIRGQVLELHASAGSRQIKQTVNASAHVTPAINGRHYLGASYNRHSNSPEIDLAESRQLLEAAGEIYPGMFREEDISKVWVGFRTMSKDRVPVVGAVPDSTFFESEYADICHGKVHKTYPPAHHLQGLYISAAHGSRGFTSAMLGAQIVASLVCGEPPPVSRRVLEYLNPSRFIINELKHR